MIKTVVKTNETFKKGRVLRLGINIKGGKFDKVLLQLTNRDFSCEI